jgi:hypothetical protein
MTEQRRRLRSSTVVLGGMGLLATALTSCGSDPDRRCVDRDSYEYTGGYKVVADKNCSTGSGSTAGKNRGKGGTGKGSKVDAAWYYDADVSAGRADDGTFSRSEAVDRDGFGCSGSGSGGG